MKKLFNNILTNEVTFTHQQWKMYKNKELSLLEIKQLNYLDNEISKLKGKNYNILVFLSASALMAIKKYEDGLCVSCSNLGAIDKLGNTFLGVFKGIAHWVILIVAFIELIKAIMKGGNSTTEIIGLVFKYAVIYSSIYLIPEVFDMVKETFAG